VKPVDLYNSLYTSRMPPVKVHRPL